MRVLHYPANYPDPEYGQPFNMIFVAEHVRAAALYHRNVVLYLSPLPARSGRLEVTRTREPAGLIIRIHLPAKRSEISKRVQVYACILFEVSRLVITGFVPQIIHAHVFSAARIPAALANLFRLPFIITEHWTALCREGVLSSQRLALARQLYEHSSIVLPVCDYLRKCIETNTGARFRSRIVFNAVDTRIFFNDGRTRKRQIVTVSRLEPAKDIPTLLRAMARLHQKDITLKIVGRGDSEPLRRLSDELGISEQVEFLGEQSKPAIADLMKDSSVFVLSSLWENSPCVIGEALCCGLPVVATNVGGVPELVKQGDGLLVPPSQPAALAGAMDDVLAHSEMFLPNEIAARAQAHFSYEAIGAQLNEVYCEATQV